VHSEYSVPKHCSFLFSTGLDFSLKKTVLEEIEIPGLVYTSYALTESQLMSSLVCLFLFFIF
jgi:hypothetical protein